MTDETKKIESPIPGARFPQTPHECELGGKKFWPDKDSKVGDVIEGRYAGMIDDSFQGKLTRKVVLINKAAGTEYHVKLNVMSSANWAKAFPPPLARVQAKFKIGRAHV